MILLFGIIAKKQYLIKNDNHFHNQRLIDEMVSYQ
ncbi:hypothetical protein F991_01952 [Acinetobacter sp. CIP-A165]|nr:hypothetical protein F991_01952 [Acinetobacter sp. CIP-A165]